MIALAAELARLAARIGEVRRHAARGPLPAAQLAALTRHVGEVTALIGRLVDAEAALAESRGLDLEPTRAALAQARRLELDTSMVQVVALERAGRVRSAAQTFWRLIGRAPRDAAWADRLAGLGHLLERHGALGGGACLTLVGSLPVDWWRDPVTRASVAAALGEIRIDWTALPEAV
ncbi:MAG: hypothetical protein R3B06_23090 [Kofleriaceae bacterium]